MKLLIRKVSCLSPILLGFLLMLGGCEKKSLLSDDLAGFDPEGDIAQFGIAMKGPGVAAGERLLDLGNAKLYNLDDAGTAPEKIDFILLWGSASGMNLVSPSDIDRLTSWNPGETINNTWMVKNKTEFIKLDSSEASQSIYENIKGANGLKSSYEQAGELVKQQENYSLNDHGPAQSIRNLSVGDVLFLKTSKDVYAVAKITNVSTGTSGSLDLAIKLDNRNQKEIPSVNPSEVIEYYNVELNQPGFFAGKRFLDFSSGATFSSNASLSEENAFANQEKIDLAFFNSTSRGDFNFISLDNDERLNSWSSGSEIAQSWLVRNSGEFVKMDASEVADSIFLNTYRKSTLREAYTKALASVIEGSAYQVDVHGPGKHISEIKNGDLIFFKSESKNIIAMAQVTSHTSGGSGALALKVKVDNSEKIIVAPPPIRTLTLTGVGASTADFIDFNTVQVLSADAAEADPGSIDMAHLRGSSTGHNLISITSGASFGSWTAALRERIEAWPVRNETKLINLGAANEYLVLYESLDENDRSAMETAYELAESLYNPEVRLRNLNNGDIVLLNSVDRDIIVAIKVIEADAAGNLTIDFKVSKK